MHENITINLTNQQLFAYPGEKVQTVLKICTPAAQSYQIRLSVSGWEGTCQLLRLESVPSAYPCHEDHDEDYLGTKSGLYPDLLRPLGNLPTVIAADQEQETEYYLDFGTDNLAAASYSLILQVAYKENQTETSEIVEIPLTIRVNRQPLQEQKLIHTEWFYVDCLAQYYQLETWSPEHWQAIDSFMASAAQHGVNMILTPVFTPPLDTEPGHKRLTTQLVKMKLEDGHYHFDFSKLGKWMDLCRKHGMKYLEMAHFFTQWGAEFTPQIVVDVEGKEEDIFGWHVKATDPCYQDFLQQFIPALQTYCLEQGFDREHVYFHISDEPHAENLPSYLAAKAQLGDLLDGWHVIDALSDYQFYEQGIVSEPVVSNNHLTPFLEHQVPNLWTYYCTGQGVSVPNRFMAMPTYRNRVMGLLLYWFELKGFLHWGFNFYMTHHSLAPIDPYEVTDGGGRFPSGDPFLVYPGPLGQVYDSRRAQVQDQALEDLRALETLEAKAGRKAVVALIEQELETSGFEKTSFDFFHYPREEEFYNRLATRVWEQLNQA